MIIKTPKYLKVSNLLSYLSFIHMGIMCWNLMQILRNEKNVVPQIISSAVTACTTFTAVCRWTHYKPAKDIVCFLNCIVKSARSKKYSFSKDRIAQLRVEARNFTLFSKARTLLKYRELHILLNIMFNRIYQRDYFVFCIGSVLQY
jgi:hypothetical protein